MANLLNEIQIGILARVRKATVCEPGKDGEAPTVKHTLALVVQAPQATADELVELLSEGAAVYIVAGTRQHRLGDE
jgi:hypothetical protein